MIKEYIKLISLYNAMANSAYMSKLELLKLYREFIKEYIKVSKKIPDFYRDNHFYLNGNCYCYALMIPTPDVFNDSYNSKSKLAFSHDIGFLTGNEYSNDVGDCITNLESDLDFLNISYYDSDIDEENKHNGYKIAFYKSFDDFHFLRENKDGTWSHKLGYDGKIVRVVPDDIILGDYRYVKTLELVK